MYNSLDYKKMTVVIDVTDIYYLTLSLIYEFIEVDENYAQACFDIGEYMVGEKSSFTSYAKQLVNNLISVILYPIIINNAVTLDGYQNNAPATNMSFEYQNSQRIVNQILNELLVNTFYVTNTSVNSYVTNPVKLKGPINILAELLELMIIRVITSQFPYIDSFPFSLEKFDIRNTDLFLIGRIYDS